MLQTMLSISERQSAGLDLKDWERGFDGTGDRLAALLFGWVLPTIVAAAAVAARWWGGNKNGPRRWGGGRKNFRSDG